ncbi:Rne/Rng family ribonuclease [Bacillus pinisoli]|uniref:Rne/Rng family ribonuclease n=1 Tax=Bacillus pinisoli TaxID=2901866 RepID=UPI001FF48C06|nr:Rne/Rng family ribonuclease [Bacillus pinisoli]
MKRKIVMNVNSSEKRVAVLEHDQPVEFYFSHPGLEDISGNIYAGRVTKVLPGMQAVFVDIGLERNGFLHRDQLLSYHLLSLSSEEKRKKNVSEFVREGELLLVQVEKNSVGNKGPKLSNIIELSGQCVVYLPNGQYIAVSKKMNEEIRLSLKKELQLYLTENEGVIVRTAAEQVELSQIKDELSRLRIESEKLQQQYKQLKKPTLLKSKSNQFEKVIHEVGINSIEKMLVDDFNVYQELKIMYPHQEVVYYQERENIFSHHQIEAELERLQSKIVWLSNGAYLIIEHTEALTVIDVNTGKFTGKTNLKDTVLKTNEQAALEIARQIRLRDIGGMILIDFIDMKSEAEKNKIQKVFNQELQKDRTRTIVYGFTRLGILEMTRKRVRENVNFQQSQDCQVCGNGHVPAKEVLAYKLERELLELRGRDEEGIWVEATEDVMTIFQQNQGILIEGLKNKLHMEIVMTSLIAPKPSYHIRHIGSIADIQSRLKRID